MIQMENWHEKVKVVINLTSLQVSKSEISKSDLIAIGSFQI